jgi:hypothetical protein
LKDPDFRNENSIHSLSGMKQISREKYFTILAFKDFDCPLLLIFFAFRNQLTDQLIFENNHHRSNSKLTTFTEPWQRQQQRRKHHRKKHPSCKQHQWQLEQSWWWHLGWQWKMEQFRLEQLEQRMRKQCRLEHFHMKSYLEQLGCWWQLEQQRSME